MKKLKTPLPVRNMIGMNTATVVSVAIVTARLTSLAPCSAAFIGGIPACRRR